MKKILHKNKGIIIFLVILIVMLLERFAYAKYINNISVSYQTTSGEMICNIDIDKNDSYVVNGIPYVIITVKNYDENDNITAVGVDYNLTIKNKDSFNGTYIWQKINAQDNTKYDEGIKNYLDQVTTNTYSFGNSSKEENKFKVFIKSSLTTYEDLNFDVELDSVQKNIK